MPSRLNILFAPALLLPAAAFAQPQPFDVAAARMTLVGDWQGKLEYLDYSANQWFGVPVRTRVEDQGDGATFIRKSDFDDGPSVGNVRITTVELFDTKQSQFVAGSFRKGRTVEVMTFNVRLEGTANSPANWTWIEETLGRDDNRPATLRLTTRYSGNSLTTLKEVDFQDDDKQEWLTRNRTVLTRVSN